MDEFSDKMNERVKKVMKKLSELEKRANSIVPDFEDSTPEVLKRRLTIKIPHMRMTKFEIELVHEEFERISTNGLLDKYTFRMEVMGPQVPDLISNRIFDMFG